MTTHARCQSLFRVCALHDDKTTEMLFMKYLEELGEFFREYLIIYSKLLNRKSLTHRSSSLPRVYEEAIDCLITLTAHEGAILPLWHPDLSLPHTLEDLADAIKDFNLSKLANSLACLLPEDEFYSVLYSKLNKWNDCLLANGLLDE